MEFMEISIDVLIEIFSFLSTKRVMEMRLISSFINSEIVYEILKRRIRENMIDKTVSFDKIINDEYLTKKRLRWIIRFESVPSHRMMLPKKKIIEIGNMFYDGSTSNVYYMFVDCYYSNVAPSVYTIICKHGDKRIICAMNQFFTNTVKETVDFIVEGMLVFIEKFRKKQGGIVLMIDSGLIKCNDLVKKHPKAQLLMGMVEQYISVPRRTKTNRYFSFGVLSKYINNGNIFIHKNFISSIAKDEIIKTLLYQCMLMKGMNDRQGLLLIRSSRKNEIGDNLCMSLKYTLYYSDLYK